MRPGGRIARIATATAVCCALWPAVAAAGDAPYGNLGLVYTGTTTNWTELPGRAEQSTYDPCAAPTRLASVGAWVSESVPVVPNRSAFALGKGYNVSIHHDEQIPGAPTPDSTHQVADNLFAIDNDLTLGETTVCATDAGQVGYPSRSRATPKRARTTARVDCAGGRHALSGGALASGPFKSQRLVASAPFDDGDAGAKPDDGWRVAVDNLGKRRRSLDAFAICSSVTGLTYEEQPFRVRKRARKHVELTCPAGQFIVGGGVSHGAPRGKATLVASRLNLGELHSWITEVDNLSRKRSRGRAFAICHA